MSEAEDERCWNDYVAAAKKAQATLKIGDALEARRAWAKFIGSDAPPPSVTVEAAE